MKNTLITTLAIGLISQSSFARVVGLFDTTKDILIAQFDNKPDPDDIHSLAALGCILRHPDLANVRVYAVAGSIGNQGGIQIEADSLFNLIFGNNWTDAIENRTASVTRVRVRAERILLNGGKVFVQEAGQSDITSDWIAALVSRGLVPLSVIKSNVIVVQHSEFNEKMTTRADLDAVKRLATYIKIDNGNLTNGTPDYELLDTSFIPSVLGSSNLNANTKAFWTEAESIITDQRARRRNPTISAGGVDFSDCVENWYIFGIGSNADSVPKFFARYVLN